MLKHQQRNRLACWSVHLLTSLGALLCVVALICMHEHNWIEAFYAMAACLVIDAIDGTLARKFQVSRNIPQIDGGLLDNLVDFVSYVIVPCFFIYTYGLVSDAWTIPIISLIIFSSCYQFSHVNAKTKDDFFRGFPCYWNLTVFYLMIIEGSETFNTGMLLLFVILVFVPIRYLYLSKMNYVTNSNSVKYSIYASTALFILSATHLLICYPEINNFFYVYSFVYMIAYGLFSIYRTCKPLTKI